MKSRTLFIAIIIITFGGLLLADGLGYWQTTSNKQPTRINQGAYKGLPNPEDIRGSYTFLDIEKAFAIDSSVLARAFNIDTNNPDLLKAMDIEKAYSYLGDDFEIGTGSVRLFVSIYTGVPYVSVDNLPSTAVKVLEEHGKWTDTLEEELGNYIIPVDDTPIPFSPSPDTKSPDEEHPVTGEISGKTTVKDVINFGLTLKEVEEIMGMEIKNTNLPIRDLCEQNGLSFGTIKAAIYSKLAE
ncbi:MAG: hypothetical protein ACOX4L_03620 [Bacillota bacterium]|jgi:hypothetical protein